MIKMPEWLPLRTSYRGTYLWLVFLGIVICYALLVFPTINRLGIGWDEATDFVIAQAYQRPENMLLGHAWDPSQTRLPMLMVAVVFRLLGTSDLLSARVTTVLVGGITLLGIFLYGKHRFKPATGLLAAGLLAINPFFLAFARLAFTESDVYVACALTWLLVVLSRFETKPSLGWAMLSGVFLGLALSSKATALVIIPVAATAFVLSQVYRQKSADRLRLDNLAQKSILVVLLWSGWAILIMLAGVLIAQQLNTDAHPKILHLLNYGFVCLGWLATLIWVIRNRHVTSHPVALATFMAGFSLLTSIIFPPEHLANSQIIGALISRAAHEMTFSLGFVIELAALHTFILFLKPTPVLGLWLIAGFVLSLTQWRRRELWTPILVTAVYFLMLLFLPLGQAFYTIPLLPILSLLAADQFLRLFSNRRKISIVLAAVGLIWWGVEIGQIYPDYHLNGYQWLGARPFFGRSSIGYRSIVFVPLDGVQQAMEWLNTHAEAGQKALLYAGPRFVIDILAPDPAYAIMYGSQSNLDSKPDYVVIHISSLIQVGEGNQNPSENIFEYPFDFDVLNREYEKVFFVKRAFELEMASIWKRR